MSGPTHKYAFSSRDSDSEGGMLLRDYFAAAALTGLLSQYGKDGPEGGPAFPTGSQEQCNDLAERAYEIADTMMEERDK